MINVCVFCTKLFEPRHKDETCCSFQCNVFRNDIELEVKDMIERIRIASKTKAIEDRGFNIWYQYILAKRTDRVIDEYMKDKHLEMLKKYSIDRLLRPKK